MIASLADVEHSVGDALAKPLSFKALAQIAASLLTLRENSLGERGARAAALVRRAIAVEQRRNEIVHSMWSFGPELDPQVASRIKLSGHPPTLKGHTISIDDIRALVAEMQEILDETSYLHPLLRVKAALHA